MSTRRASLAGVADASTPVLRPVVASSVSVPAPGMSTRLAAALQAEIGRLAGIADPQDRATEITELFAGLDAYLDRASDLRADALIALHSKGWNLQALAELTGLSRSRVGRIVPLGEAALPAWRRPAHRVAAVQGQRLRGQHPTRWASTGPVVGPTRDSRASTTALRD